MSEPSAVNRPAKTASSGSGLHKQALAQVDEFFWIYDPRERRFVYVGAAFTKIWERARTPLYEDCRGYFEAIHAEDRERVRRAFFNEGNTAYDEVYRVCLPDRTTRWVRDRAFPLLHESERFAYVAGLATDMTDLGGGDSSTPPQPRDRRTTLKVDRTQDRYRQLFEKSIDPSLLIGLDGRVIEANERAVDLLGHRTSQLKRMHFSALCPSESLKMAIQYWEEVTSGQSRRFTLPVRRADGTHVAVEVSATLLDFGPEYVVQAVFREVTPRAEIARQLEATREQLAQAQKMELVGQLAGGIAHDFNNLLSVILTCAHFVERGLDEQTRPREDLRRIVEASESAAALVRRLMAFARHEVAAAELVEPEELLESIVPLLKRALPREVSFVHRVGDDLSPIFLSRVEFEQVVMNLGVNARDAMPEGGDLVIEMDEVDRAEVPAGAPMRDEVARHVRMRVSDTGEGMDRETRMRIFEPFFTTKAHANGTGLGLSTVLNIVEQNQGVVRVDSEPGAGTTFEVFFPQAQQVESHGDADATLPPPATGDETILVVDDDLEVRQLVRRILHTGGYTVLSAEGPSKALEVLGRDVVIDLLLTDINMPEYDGPTLAGRARKLRPELAVLFTSGYIDDSHTRAALSEQDACFLQKPITPSSLLAKVREVFAGATLPPIN